MMEACLFCGQPATTTVLADRQDGEQIVGSMEPYCGSCLESKRTAFGVAMRRHRMDHRISLYDVAKKNGGGLSVSDMSAMESGRAVVTQLDAASLAMLMGADPVAWAALAAEDRGEQPVIGKEQR